MKHKPYDQEYYREEMLVYMAEKHFEKASQWLLGNWFFNSQFFLLEKWIHPKNYFGATWEEYYSAGFGQSRDSEELAESNFRVALRELGGESETVIVVNASHWAVGWVEWIAIHESDLKSIVKANMLKAYVEDIYALLDEDDFSDLESEHRQKELEAELDDPVDQDRYERLIYNDIYDHDSSSLNYDLISEIKGNIWLHELPTERLEDDEGNIYEKWSSPLCDDGQICRNCQYIKYDGYRCIDTHEFFCENCISMDPTLKVIDTNQTVLFTKKEQTM